MIKKKEEKIGKKISYRLKEASVCPVCSNSHHREELLSGGGRLIAGSLTKELRRLYKPSSRYGIVYPMAFSVQVCPQCLYASFPKDFKKLSKDEVSSLKPIKNHREKVIQILFGKINFETDKNLIVAIASHLLAVDCYHFREKEIAPTVKMAILCLRLGWLFDDLFKDAPYRPYDKARDFYYLRAVDYYSKTLEYMQTGKEPVESVFYLLGPDTDHNWGYEGILYLNSYLLRKKVHLSTKSKVEKIKELGMAKKYLSKIYGTGKSNKGKPGPIIDMAKDLFNDLTDTLKKMES